MKEMNAVLRRFGCVLGCIAMLFAGMSAAQTYPTKPVRLVVPWPPGGAADLAARPLAEKLSLSLGQPVIVENLAGATGTIGAGLVARSPADGYTLLFATSNEITMSPAVYPKISYDPTVDLAPVTTVTTYPNVLVVGPRLKEVASLKDLLSASKTRPKGLTFASGGSGSTNHLTLELLKTLVRVNATHIPYKGGGPALTDVMGGHVDALFATLPSAVAHVKAGKLRALVVTSERRASHLPDVPSAVEADVPGLIVTTWSGVLAPPQTPREIVVKLNAEISKAVQAPDLSSKLRSTGDVRTTTPDEFAAIIKREFGMWSKLVKDANVTPD